MTALKMVKGKPVAMTPEEEAAFRAEQAAMTAHANAVTSRQATLAELASIDAASIRAIRETLAALPNATPELRQRESEAQTARAKLS